MTRCIKKRKALYKIDTRADNTHIQAQFKTFLNTIAHITMLWRFIISNVIYMWKVTNWFVVIRKYCAIIHNFLKIYHVMCAFAVVSISVFKCPYPKTNYMLKRKRWAVSALSSRSTHTPKFFTLRSNFLMIQRKDFSILGLYFYYHYNKKEKKKKESSLFAKHTSQVSKHSEINCQSIIYLKSY